MKNKLLENLIKYPILFYIFYFIYTIRPPFKLMISSADRYESLFHYILILWGLIIIGYNLINRRDIFSRKNVGFIVAWIIISILTIISNISNITTTSIKSIILTILSIMFFIIGYPLLKEKYSRLQIFKYIFYPVLGVKILINAISIYLYISNVSIFIIRGNLLDFLGVRYVGLANGRYTLLLYGLYKDPNFTAMMGASLILLSIYIYTKAKCHLIYFEKIFLVISMVLESIIVSFSNSRGTIYSMLAIVVLVVVFIMLNRYREGDLLTFSTGKRILIILFSSILVYVTYAGIQKGGFLISQNNKNTKYIYAEENKVFVKLNISDLDKEEFSEHKGWVLEYLDEDEDGSKEEKISVSKDDSGEEVGNGRIAIWKDTVKLFSHKPIFGIAPEMQKVISNEEYNYLDIPSMKEGRSIHNSYLAVLLYYGVMGGLIVTAVFFRRLKPLFVKEIKYGYVYESLIFYTILFSLAASVFLESIFVNIDFQQIYLMFLLGVVSTEYEKKGGY